MRFAAALVTIVALGLLLLVPPPVAILLSCLILLAWPILDRSR
ncbi:hypothetical protein [Methylobacterium nodulans]|uniref:Uncharacterized protein n=1 Tax=Methylobacterium nodulans (strain LMG 21967 / CNCM I-2342 / ORS 2060) TaxID=460265 RepID=B8IB74_METNO|nr:hypothetical protein [Methylobacterium nodulans]ACL57289.1 conserved hypothetical protein [Methylobacterium nodulans ORS 2060]